jgi:hypothetical protein
MEAFAASMYPHSVYLLPLSESTDPDAGVVEAFPSTTGLTPVACRVRLVRTVPGFGGEAETGQTTDAEVAFPVNPGLAKGSRLQRVSDGLQLRVIGRPKDRADGFNFVVTCQVIE